jgi:hypothetical protein
LAAFFAGFFAAGFAFGDWQLVLQAALAAGFVSVFLVVVFFVAISYGSF